MVQLAGPSNPAPSIAMKASAHVGEQLVGEPCFQHSGKGQGKDKVLSGRTVSKNYFCFLEITIGHCARPLLIWFWQQR